jgi:hypothetical protein
MDFFEDLGCLVVGGIVLVVLLVVLICVVLFLMGAVITN